MVSGINTKYLILVCVLLWLAMVISNVPAVWGAWLIQQFGPVRMSQVSGSLWSGRAAEVAVNIDRKPLFLGAMSWELNPLSLLIVRPCAAVKLQAEGQNLKADVCGGLGGLSVSNGDLNAPAAILGPWLPVQIAGRISARIESADFDSNFKVTELIGSVGWDQASYNNSGEWMALGAYSASLSPDGQGGVKADLVDRGGPLQLKMEVVAREGVALKGNVLLRKDAPRVIQQSLPLVGDKLADGSYAIDMSL